MSTSVPRPPTREKSKRCQVLTWNLFCPFLIPPELNEFCHHPVDPGTLVLMKITFEGTKTNRTDIASNVKGVESQAKGGTEHSSTERTTTIARCGTDATAFPRGGPVVLRRSLIPFPAAALDEKNKSARLSLGALVESHQN